jgi:hypothetical protein
MMEREFIPLSRTSSRLSHRKNSAFARIFGRSLGSSVGGIITVLTSLNCGVEVLCFHALEPDLNCYTQGACVASLNRLMPSTTLVKLTVPTHVPVVSSNTPYSLPVLRVLTLSSKRRIWIRPRDVGIGHASEVGASRRVRGTTMAAKQHDEHQGDERE